MLALSLERRSPSALALFVFLVAVGCDGTDGDEAAMTARVAPMEPSERPAIPPLAAARWFDTDFGWIVSESGEDIGPITEEMHAAAQKFAEFFERSPGRGAVIDLGLAQHAGLLREAGAEWVMHWRKPTLSGPDRSAPPTEILRHEIGHLLFMTYIWPNIRGTQYGGDAPDWLDEAAAVLMETPASTWQRRKRFGDMDAAGRLIPLADYLAMIHPFFRSPAMQDLLRDRQNMDKPERGAIAMELSPETRALEIDFYAQTRGFVDFLLETTGNEHVILEIAHFLKAGGTMDGWLAESATARTARLGESVEALEQRWRAWIEARWSGHGIERDQQP